MPARSHVGSNLTLLKQTLGFGSLRELASAAGLDRSTLSKIISGGAIVSDTTLSRLATAFNLTIHDLLLPPDEFAVALRNLDYSLVDF